MPFAPRLFIAAALAVIVAPLALAGAPPTTEKRPVTDELQGVKIVDDYRWLEDWNDEAVKEWSKKQNEYARTRLDAIKCAPALRARLTELENSVGVEYHDVHYAGGRYFASKSQPPKEQPLIVSLPSLESTKGEVVIFDPNVVDKEGGTSFDWFVPSPDGKYVAISLSEGGSEAGNVHIYHAADGRELKEDVVPRVNGGTAGGSMAWMPDSSGFFYTRYPREGEREGRDMHFYTMVFFHKMGTPTSDDRYECGKDYPKINEIEIEVSPKGDWVLTNVQNGDGGEFIQDVRPIAKEGEWTRLTKWEDRVVEAKFGRDGAMYLISRSKAPMGKVLRLELSESEAPSLAKATELIPEQKEGSIESSFDARGGIWLTDSRIYVAYQMGGPNNLRAFNLKGKALDTIPQPPFSTIEGVMPLEGDDLAFAVDSYTTPPAYYHYRAGETDGKMTKTALFVPEPPGMPRLGVRREFAVSKDGTRVPVHIVAREEVLVALAKIDAAMASSKDGASKTQAVIELKDTDGSTLQMRSPIPTVVWGYGGYGVNMTPTYSRRRLLWVEQGGIFAIANIRGGGEYGDRWHLEGNLTKKQNVFDDFYAATRYMIEKGYTTPDKMAIVGGSNGGLLMGATFTQHPDVCKAVVSSVGIYDMLRVELSPNGEFNITEFGTVQDKEQFRAMHAYSPYHHVKEGTKYPAILFLTGANDPRVDPMQSRKMTALLQAAQQKFDGGTVLLRTSGNTGHGMGTPLSARIEQSVDLYGFLFDQLGLACKEPKAKK